MIQVILLMIAINEHWYSTIEYKGHHVKSKWANENVSIKIIAQPLLKLLELLTCSSTLPATFTLILLPFLNFSNYFYGKLRVKIPYCL